MKEERIWKKCRWLEEPWVMMGFILPFVTMLFVMFIMQITPFGPYSLLVSDANVQDIDRITGLRNIIFEGKSYFYTWSQIQGSTPFSFLAIDPFNIFYLLAREEHILEMVTIVTCLKVGCAGWAVAFYLKKVFKRNDLSISIFAWCYALMGFSIAYHYLLSFENAAILLPLVLYGVERLLEDKKQWVTLTILLAISFTVDYYGSYIIGIYAFLYFCYRCALQETHSSSKQMVEKFIRFLLSPILAFGIVACFLLPILLMMRNRDGLFAGNNLTMYLRYDLPALFSKLFIGSYDTMRPGGLPFIYTGIITLIVIGFLFSSYAISYKEKVLSFSLLGFMILSLTLNPLYVGWHGFKPPVCFEGRFSYLISLTMVFLGYKGYCLINTVTTQQIHRIFLVLATAFLVLNRKEYTFLKDESLLYTLLFLGAYYSVFMIIKKGNYPRVKLQILLGVLVAMELSCNAHVTIKNMDKLLKYPLEKDYVDSTQTLKEITQEIQEKDKAFYRIEFVKKRGCNDGFGMGFPSISHFNSIYDYKVKEVIGQLGMATGHNWIRYEGSTPILDTLLNIKYVVSPKENYFGYQPIANKEENYIMENPYALSVGFMIKEELNEETKGITPLMLQEQVLNKMIGDTAQHYFLDLPVEKKEMTNNNRADKLSGKDEIYYVKDRYKKASLDYQVQTKTQGPCFMTIYAQEFHAFNVYVNDQLVQELTQSGQESIYLGNYKEKEVLSIKIEQKEELFAMQGITFSQLDEANVTQAMKILGENSLVITEHGETQLKGHVKVEQDRPYLFTAIPYDKGWQVYVDGEEVATQRILQAFLGIKLEPGEHEILLKYCPVGWRLGVGISIFSIFLLISAINYEKKLDKKNKNKVKKVYNIL